MSIMHYRLITAIVSLVIFVSLVIWDVFLAADKIIGNTISEVIQYYALNSFTLPLAFGILGGHWFWTSTYSPPWWVKLISLSSLGCVSVGLDIWLGISKQNAPAILRLMQSYPIIWVVVGIFLGRFFWAQGT